MSSKMMRSNIRPIAKRCLQVVSSGRAIATRQWGEFKEAEKIQCDAPPAFKQASAVAEIAKDAVKPVEAQDMSVTGLKEKKRTLAELDEELRLRLDGVSGEGGSAGIEYEGGKAVGLKRGVRENMFRVI